MVSNYKIVFDRNCGVCRIGSQTLLKTGMIQEDNILGLDNFHEDRAACNVDPQRACNEMAVVNKTSHEVRYGMEGYAWLLEEQYPRFAKFWNSAFFKVFLSPFYKLFASNRRVIAPVGLQEGLCMPDLHKGRRLAYISLVVLVACIVTYIKGTILADPMEPRWYYGLALISITGPGWILALLVYSGNDKWEYAGHLASIVATAMGIQILALVAWWLMPNPYWIVVSMVLSEIIMILIHYKRMKLLEKPQGYTLKWWIALHGTAALIFSLYLF